MRIKILIILLLFSGFVNAQLPALPQRQVIGLIDSLGRKVDTSRLAVVDTTDRNNTNTFLKWDSANRKYIHVPEPSSGSGTYTPPYLIQFKPGLTSNAPAAGDSTITRDTLIGKWVELYREGENQFYNDTIYGYEIDSNTGKITVHPPFTAGERVKMYVGNWTDTVSLGAPSASWVNLPFSTLSGTLSESPAHVFVASTNNWDAYGLSDYKLPAGIDGGIIFEVVASTGVGDVIMGFNTANTNGSFSGMEAGFYAVWNGGTNTTFYYIENGGASPVGSGLGVVGEYLGVFRVGSTLTLRESTTKSTNIADWSVVYTFGTFTSAADLFININVNNNNGQKMHNPQGLNTQ